VAAPDDQQVVAWANFSTTARANPVACSACVINRPLEAASSVTLRVSRRDKNRRRTCRRPACRSPLARQPGERVSAEKAQL
jgi:hypothetical protein